MLKRLVNWLWETLVQLKDFLLLLVSDSDKVSSKRFIAVVGLVVLVWIIIKTVETGNYAPDYYIYTLAALITGVQTLTKFILKR